VRFPAPNFVTFKDDYRDLSRRFLLIVGESRHDLLLASPYPLALFSLGDARPDGNDLRSDFDGGIGIGQEVVKPVRVCWRASFGGEDRPRAIAETLAGDRVDSLDPTLGTAMMQEQQGMAFKCPPNLSLVSSEFLDDLVVPVGHV
jgi:hypothetical protein